MSSTKIDSRKKIGKKCTRVSLDIGLMEDNFNFLLGLSFQMGVCLTIITCLIREKVI